MVVRATVMDKVIVRGRVEFGVRVGARVRGQC